MDIKGNIIYPELSYKIIGILFDVWNDLGYGHKELFYGKAIANHFKEDHVRFKEQLSVPVAYHGSEIGTYRFDFLVEDKIVLEIKKRDFFSKRDIKQLYMYLKAANLQLGIIAHFTSRGVLHKRVLNIK